MCGISGFLSMGGKSSLALHDALPRMNRSLVHRGPDDEGTWMAREDGIYLAHRRLSIQDTSENGRQPMQTQSGNVIVFNGEIYNFKELRKADSNYKYRSGSDTEVLLRAYEKFGVSALNRLNGMFAFAIWDVRRKSLFLARDRFGIKPLYYSMNGGFFAFASEIRALLKLPWISQELDLHALYNFLTFGSLMAPETMFQGIHKLPPGHFIEVNTNEVKTPKQYWEVQYEDYSQKSEHELTLKLADRLETAVRRRMISDVPVGAFLSGGVDSSSVVSFMRGSEPSANIKTFSIGFEGQPEYDELNYARSISAQFKTEHYEKTVTPKEFKEFMPKIAEIFDEPLSDPTSIPIFFISQLAQAEGTKVVLTGDGADEILFGYRSWLKYARLYPLFNLLKRLPSSVLGGLAHFMPPASRSVVLNEMLSRLKQRQEFFWGGASAFKESEKQDLLGESHLFDGFNSHELVGALRCSFDGFNKKGARGHLDWMCFMGTKFVVPGIYLHRADRLGMANSVELRVPFLDHELVNMALSIPATYKIKQSEPKYILKKAMEPYLPRSVLYRKKKGFCVPLREWGAEIMLDFLADEVGPFCQRVGFFNEKFLRSKIHASRSGQTESVYSLWNMYFLINWFKSWAT
jgi:asparagine synthase (glutamine-hydrolysing)